MAKLTKSVVDVATPREKQFTIWCSELKGFGIFVQPSGSRTYFVDYRNREGVRKRMTIGRHGKITAEEARKLAIATLGETVKGRDPFEERIRLRCRVEDDLFLTLVGSFEPDEVFRDQIAHLRREALAVVADARVERGQRGRLLVADAEEEPQLLRVEVGLGAIRERLVDPVAVLAPRQEAQLVRQLVKRRLVARRGEEVGEERRVDVLPRQPLRGRRNAEAATRT